MNKVCIVEKPFYTNLSSRNGLPALRNISTFELEVKKQKFHTDEM